MCGLGDAPCRFDGVGVGFGIVHSAASGRGFVQICGQFASEGFAQDGLLQLTQSIELSPLIGDQTFGVGSNLIEIPYNVTLFERTRHFETERLDLCSIYMRNPQTSLNIEDIFLKNL